MAADGSTIYQNGALVKEGLTTLGEYWEENPRSHCHDMMGHIIEWYYNGWPALNHLSQASKKFLLSRICRRA